MEIITRVLTLLAAAPDEPKIAIALQPSDLPPGFVFPIWISRSGVLAGRVIAAAVVDRPEIVEVVLTFPGQAMPIQFAVKETTPTTQINVVEDGNTLLAISLGENGHASIQTPKTSHAELADVAVKALLTLVIGRNIGGPTLTIEFPGAGTKVN